VKGIKEKKFKMYLRRERVPGKQRKYKIKYLQCIQGLKFIQDTIGQVSKLYPSTSARHHEVGQILASFWTCKL
jgi:hypothetical protein